MIDKDNDARDGRQADGHRLSFPPHLSDQLCEDFGLCEDDSKCLRDLFKEHGNGTAAERERCFQLLLIAIAAD